MLFGTSGMTNDGRGEYLATTGDGSISATVGACTGILTGAWDVIAIGTSNAAGNSFICDVNSDGTFDETCADAEFHDELTQLGIELESTDLVRGVATTKTWTNGTGATTTKIVLKNTFTSTSGSTESVTESGLFNSTVVAGSGMLAHQTFTAVSLTSGDSITVTWTFTVGD